MILQMVNGEHILLWYNVFEWHNRFKNGHESLEDDPCSREHITSWNGDHMRQV